MSPPNLVLAVDFATHAQEIAQAAARIAVPMGALVRVLYVVNTGPQVSPDALVQLGEDDPKTALELLTEDARRQVWPILVMLQGQGLRASLCLRTGDVVDAIASCAAESDAAMVVIGCDLAAGLRKLVRGSVTEAVIQRAPCPVLVVRAQGPAAGRSQVQQQVEVEADG